MKTRILFTVLMFGMIVVVFAQKPTITLTFSADSNSRHVPINSILIKNLTNGCDTTLYGLDTVLLLYHVLGLDENSNIASDSFLLFQNYPNPIENKTIVSIWLPKREDILITIFDGSGREVVKQEFQLEQGAHTFNFYPGRESLYFLNAKSKQQSRTIKMFNSPVSSNVMGFCKLDYNGIKVFSGGYKSEVMSNNFIFVMGDQLKYTAYSYLGSREIIDNPIGNQTYTFQFGSAGTPCPGMPTVTDIDGNVYNTVLIGTQCWMKENLKTTTYRNGMAIPFVWENSIWPNLTTGACCWYQYFPTWKDTYGALYNWFATVDSNGLCPTGWHVPTNDEWSSLADYTDPTQLLAGSKLRSCRQVNSPLSGDCNTNEHPRWEEDVTLTITYGTNDYGFSALPGGWRLSCGDCISMGYTGFWWTSDGFVRVIQYYDSGFKLESFNWASGISVRCLRD